MWLGGFQVVAFDANRQRSLNGIYRDDQGALFLRHKNSLNTLQRSAANAYTLPDLEKWVWPTRQLLLDHLPNCLYLLLGNRDFPSAKAYKRQHAIDHQSPQAFTAPWRQPYE